ncbi:hypothetical protein BUALT_Bualt14G0013600 [Buddleja alternifolia]|uniref:Uncharacterized protein n=1 Tax=Buddleja alternifolia TaxID=168488 RepID=A0AAV6WPF1_9LAMI|nr:hypothetical protein BUALT_Bualt14G0013600 [Buddleja alternifolia]
MLSILGVHPSKLRASNVVVQGFNQSEQRPLGKITLRTKFDVIEENTEFLVIEADTSYNALLGRLWYHANGVVPSTYHQCLKFSLGKDKDGNEKEGCIIADNAPFSKEESYYADARYYNIPKHQKKDDKKKEEVENRKTSKCLFRYVPKSQRLPEDGGLRPTNLVRTLKNDYSFTLKRTDCSHVENSNQFIVPRKGDKPIRFYTPIDEGYSNLDGPESSSKEGLDIKEAEYNPKMMQMFHKMGLKREEADSPEQRPLFDKIMSNEHRIALLTGNKLKTNRQGVGFKDKCSSKKESINLTSVVNMRQKQSIFLHTKFKFVPILDKTKSYPEATSLEGLLQGQTFYENVLMTSMVWLQLYICLSAKPPL